MVNPALGTYLVFYMDDFHAMLVKRVTVTQSRTWRGTIDAHTIGAAKSQRPT